VPFPFQYLFVESSDMASNDDCLAIYYIVCRKIFHNLSPLNQAPKKGHESERSNIERRDCMY
jgi:hypothetical protein